MLALLGIPSIISSILTFLTPVAGGLISFIGWYLTELWSGLKIVMANVSTWLVIATVAGIASYSAVQYFEKECPKVTQSKPSNSSTNWNPFNGSN